MNKTESSFQCKIARFSFIEPHQLENGKNGKVSVYQKVVVLFRLGRSLVCAKGDQVELLGTYQKRG